jgi:hypothetical protein
LSVDNSITTQKVPVWLNGESCKLLNTSLTLSSPFLIHDLSPTTG